MQKDRFSVRFWGVRGSMATARPECCGVGGNTSCVEVRAGDELIILDAGTGLYGFGATLRAPVAATFLLSHFHWDHIQGFPFFAPLYEKGNRFTVVGPADGACDTRCALENLMADPHFPVALGDVCADLRFHSQRPGDEMRVGAARITCATLNHPQGCLGYRIEMGGRSVVYATDTEPRGGSLDDELLDLARGASLLIFDAQYTEAEYHGHTGKARRGWGHSTVEEACRVANAARVERLALFHHDPSRDDSHIDALLRDCRSRFADVIAAREGLAIDLAASADRRRLVRPHAPIAAQSALGL
jgi:phosphoribosyl 1,2-cyclic phosphodiesterase